MPKSYFVVRSTIDDASKRQAFDSWYQKVHFNACLALARFELARWPDPAIEKLRLKFGARMKRASQSASSVGTRRAAT
jgi:hypothetical protein